MMLPTDDFAAQVLYNGTAPNEKSVVENYSLKSLLENRSQCFLQIGCCAIALPRSKNVLWAI